MELTIVILSYIICSIFAGIKQYHVESNRTDIYEVGAVWVAIIISPIWIIVVFVRQFIIRDWE